MEKRKRSEDNVMEQTKRKRQEEGRQGESEAEKQMAAERRQIETCWDSQRGTAGSMESQKNVSGKGREEARGREGKAGQRARMSLSKLHRLFVGFFSVLSSFL